MPKSPFPDEFLGVDLEYDGVWNPIDLGTDLDQAGFRVAHGARDEGGEADASSLSFTVANGTGKYSPRNPSSPLFGKISRNTPARARVALGAPWLDLETPAARATTPDTSNLDITGDIDIRWWGYRDSWTVAADLISKYSTTGNQRSWLLRAEANGTLCLFWSVDGTAVLEARSTVPLPSWAGEVAVRVTLDVDNGAAGRTAQFFYAETLSLGTAPDTGAWVQLGTDVVQASTTSIFNSTAVLTLGKEPTSAAGTPPQQVYGWSVRSGIAGAQTTRTQAVVSDVAAGSVSFADSTGKVFTVTDGSVTNAHSLAVCEVAEWPMDWNRTGGPSVLTTVEANGVSRRLGQGEEALDSAIYRSITNKANPNLIAYWPMEDGTEATSFGAAVGRYSTGWAGDPSLAAYDGFGGSNPIPTFGDTRSRFRSARVSATAGIQVRHLMHVPAAGIPDDTRLLTINFYANDPPDLGSVTVYYRPAGGLELRGYNSDGTDIGGSGPVAFDVDGKDLRVAVTLIQDGSDVDFILTTVDADASGLQWSGTLSGRPLTSLQDVILNPGRVDLGQTAFGHMTIENSISTVFDVQPAVLAGYEGEAASTRLTRLSAERGVPVVLRSVSSLPTPLGPQRADTFLNLVRQTVQADGGIVHDDPSSVSLRYRSLYSLGSQPAVVIPYDDNRVIPFRPVDDDGLIRNRVTVERPGGSRVTKEATVGALSTQPVPDGVGVYAEALTRNVETDELADRTASWLLHVGTWDEGRYPTLGVDLANPFFLGNPVLTRQLLRLVPGDRLVILDPPSWLPPFSVDVLVMGVQVDATPHSLRLTWTCIPARPYRVGYWNAGHRYSAEGTVLTSGVSATTTTLPLTLPELVSWTHADGDYEILVGGELMRVTNVSGGNSMTVLRSLNGVVKAHSAGAAVALADPSFYAR